MPNHTFFVPAFIFCAHSQLRALMTPYQSIHFASGRVTCCAGDLALMHLFCISTDGMKGEDGVL